MKVHAKKSSRWKDPNFRREYLKEWRRKNPGSVERHNRQSSAKKREKYRGDSEYRERILEKAKQRWCDPEYRKRRAAYMREFRRRRREAGM